MAAYLDGKEPDEAMLKSLIRKAVVGRKWVPILCGSAFKNKGVQPLLDAVVDYLPSPLDRGSIMGIDPRNGNELERKPTTPSRSLGHRLQDRGRPLRGHHHVLPHLFEEAQQRPRRDQLRARSARSASDACC